MVLFFFFSLILYSDCRSTGRGSVEAEYRLLRNLVMVNRERTILDPEPQPPGIHDLDSLSLPHTHMHGITVPLTDSRPRILSRKRPN